MESTLPLQQSTTKNAEILLQKIDAQALAALSKEELIALTLQMQGFVQDTKNNSTQTEQALSDIMMAQDFQDLTGQLIKKVVSLLERTEKDLLALLISGAPEGAVSSTKKEDLLAGPGAVGGVQLNQENVDDLLSDLGF